MKQIIKKIGMITLSVLLAVIVVSSSFKQVNAYSNRVKGVEDPTVTDIYGNVQINSQYIDTINNGIKDVTSKNYYWNNHTVHWADFDPSSGVKIVTYSSAAADKWKMTKTKDAAREWEKQNPGWIVLAGINGDMFDIKGTGQPTGNFMQDGDMYKADLAGGTHFTIGWKSDGSVITGQPTLTSVMQLKVVDENNNVLKQADIASCNSTPVTKGINLITKDTKSTYDLTGYTVYECKYDICRISNKGYVFVKGTVGNVSTYTGQSAPETGVFYLACKDDSLDMIKTGDTVKCEYSFTGDWSDVQNTMGANYKVLENGEPIESLAGVSGTDNIFIYTTHPRTLIGIRADGSTVFMTIEGRGTIAERKVGASLYECGEILQALGCVEGYNLDGGGSTTLVAKNILGGFDVVNDPSDGSERSDGNHCFVVMRDPGFNITSDVSYDQMTLNLLAYNDTAYQNLSDISITVNGVTKKYENNALVFDGLKMNTEYVVEVSYTNTDAYDDNKRSTYTYKKTITTTDGPDYVIPEIVTFEESVKTKSMLGIKYKYTDPDGKIEAAYITYGDEKIEIKSKNGTATIQNLDFENNNYEFKLVLEYTDYLNHKVKLESNVLSYQSTKNDEPTNTEEKKKCGSKTSEIVIATISLTSALAFVLRKKH